MRVQESSMHGPDQHNIGNCILPARSHQPPASHWHGAVPKRARQPAPAATSLQTGGQTQQPGAGPGWPGPSSLCLWAGPAYATAMSCLQSYGGCSQSWVSQGGLSAGLRQSWESCLGADCCSPLPWQRATRRRMLQLTTIVMNSGCGAACSNRYGSVNSYHANGCMELEIMHLEPQPGDCCQLRPVLDSLAYWHVGQGILPLHPPSPRHHSCTESDPGLVSPCSTTHPCMGSNPVLVICTLCRSGGPLSSDVCVQALGR